MGTAIEKVELLLPNGLFGGKNQFILDRQNLTYHPTGKKDTEQTEIQLQEVESVRYGFDNVVLYRFIIGSKFKLEFRLKDGTEKAVASKVLFQDTEEHWDQYALILEALWPLLLERLVHELHTEWLQNRHLNIEPVTLTPAGIQLNPLLPKGGERFIPWSECLLQESYNYFSINSTTDVALYTNIYYHEVWNGVVLNSLLQLILKEKKK